MSNMHDPDEKAHMTGTPCKSCGHPAGIHSPLAEVDLDDPGRDGDGCTAEGCECEEFRE